jgi:hypothetical protein
LGYSAFFTKLPLNLSYRKQKLRRKTFNILYFILAKGCKNIFTHLLGVALYIEMSSQATFVDHSMNAKVTDFGFSNYAPQEGDSSASLEVGGAKIEQVK